MAIQLIALDIDGTLTSKAQQVSQRNRGAIKAAMDAGVFVTLATGRGCIATRPIWRLLEIHGPSIQYGGALTVDADTEVPLSMHALDPALIQEILQFAFEVGVHAQIYVNDVVIFEKVDSLTLGKPSEFMRKQEDTGDMIVDTTNDRATETR